MILHDSVMFKYYKLRNSNVNMMWEFYAAVLLGFLGLFAAYRSYILENEVKNEVKKRTKKLEKEIKEKEEIEGQLRKYERFFKNAEDVFFIVDNKGRFIDVNPKFPEKLGFKKDELIGKTSKRIVHPDDLEKLKRVFKSVLNGNVERAEIRFITREGETIWCDLVEWPIFDNGKVVEVEGIVRDITKRKVAEKRLKEITELLRLTNKMLRHDILNSLTAIKGYLEVYLETGDRNLIHKVMNNIDSCVDLIKRVRELELIITNGNKMKPIKVGEVARKVSNCFDVNIKIDGECTVIADDGLCSVLSNLISNAIKHSGTEKIDIKIEPQNEFCEIKVIDYGKGIPDSVKDKIFDEGFTYGSSRGTGLGLFIVKKLVERYGGNIEVKDNKPTGTIFIVRLKRQK